ncbi:MAG: sensor histidine kinase [Acidobacteriaceae bacterium]|nr:sensor histidine kinase [Acidobacteriaceae bacterium]
MRFPAEKSERGWTFYTPMLYFGFFFLQPILDHAGLKEWLLTLLGTAIFVALYLGIASIESTALALAGLAAMVLVGVLYAPFNGGASCFFIFAAALLPYIIDSELTIFSLIAVIVGVAALETWLLHLSGWFLFYSAALTLVVGVSNIYFAQKTRMYCELKRANQEIEHLAKVAERERIARDMHDVLGHTLSVIILKSELAGKLVDLDPQRAKHEIADVERTSREALAEVRNTIRGYRANGLEAELKQAQEALRTAGVKVKAEAVQITLTPAQETVVGLVVREAVTNIVRHANARNCLLRLLPEKGNCRLEIQDDGCGGALIEGNGLRGMRERIEALGGTLLRKTNPGTTLSIEFPLQAAKR